ncbi:transcriptional regulator PadR-like family protein [Moorella thermoacetica]|nr:transcriptional regulator PadR-like family protein [Moorella thermoacetica]
MAKMNYTDREYWNGIIKMCLSKFFILRVLYTHPMHGYEIARTVAQVTRGCCTPTEGTIYPVLREFEEGGYVTSSLEIAAGRERKVYTLTPKGQEAFRVAVEAWKEVTGYILEAVKLEDYASTRRRCIMAGAKGILSNFSGLREGNCCSVRNEEIPIGQCRTAASSCSCGSSLPGSFDKEEGGEIGISPDTQASQRSLDIEFLYLDLDSCTRCGGTARNLEEALNEVAGVLQATGIQVNLHKIHVQSEEQALALGFVSSPTIRINGRDIQLDVRESLCESCGEICGEDVDCRVWVYQGKEYTEAPKGMIIEAILKHVYGGGNESPAERETLQELPDNLKRFFAARRKKEEGGAGRKPAPEPQDSCCGISPLSKCCK